MSTPDTGDAAMVKGFVDEAKALLAGAEAEAEQLELLAPPTPEEMAEAREQLGPDAGRLAVLRQARDNRGRGRPPGAKNRRTDDFARYLLSFGQHPAITMMQIQATPPEVLIQASEQEKVHSFGKNGEPRIVIERMTYADAQSLRIRCAEGLMPFLESKKPVAIDATIRGVRVVEEIGGHGAAAEPIDGGMLRVAGPDEDLGETGE